VDRRKDLGPPGKLGDHVTSWLSTRSGRDGFIVLRYEDMIEDPARELVKVAKLLGIEPTRERLVRAAELSSADRMRHWRKRKARSGTDSLHTPG